MGCADPSAHGHLQVHNAERPMPSPHVEIMLPSAQWVLNGHSRKKKHTEESGHARSCAGEEGTVGKWDWREATAEKKEGCF